MTCYAGDHYFFKGGGGGGGDEKSEINCFQRRQKCLHRQRHRLSPRPRFSRLAARFALRSRAILLSRSTLGKERDCSQSSNDTETNCLENFHPPPLQKHNGPFLSVSNKRS